MVKISVPALNNRRDDILPIARHFLSEFNDKFSKKDKRFSAQAEHALESFHWKGNIIELRNCVERGVLIASGNEIQTQDLGIHNKDKKRDMNGVENGLPEISSNGIDCNEILHKIEMHYLKSALKLSNGNETKAAKFLKMSRDKFRYRRAKLGIP
ncbi:MAG: sigma-54-dependent transcriptional activator [Candidatus Magnetoglobus multicellularis str. Araruama]|uniref:Sigma-54-dependent transcriptional activator n=1 Tax=Candidatus Magnetoglobus multicellularis str. Araruama TaxID=890399 RepID=A0A1V1P1H5_9BACT|nr:MAG: sigma-54-dependent transcriptional activator [Candidatus Magnetoglobus multicellularis str. Araruama]